MPSSKIDLTGEGDYLTSGETALLQRRRWGMNQDQMAQKMGVSRRTYSRIERDEIDGAEPFNLRELKPHEKCVIYRRRVGSSQQKVATELGVSRLWVHKMEAGVVSCDDLIFYWEA